MYILVVAFFKSKQAASLTILSYLLSIGSPEVTINLIQQVSYGLVTFMT